ncbi:hypothetical protein MTBBW1_1150007 [Desulfamplus magnetovallimortis]|uniref:Uncharacterized protein n=1 Tax=Desulfamplus magnetovallimortis TaxID=1246637 RepID=A0A1W1H5W6_9BACT|nr:hypothetical protein [Desulfamplus magnetovallimortis]SLM27834.1 hypothetical protein MTBBW1_1150007 [Desulfamplus magnetovallimortis]
MNIITTFIKKLKGVFFRFVSTKIIVVIITNCAVFLIVELSEIVKQLLKSMNQSFLSVLYLVEGWLFATVNDIYSKFEELLTGLQEKVESALNSLMPEEFNIILSLIQFAAWLDALIKSIVSSIKSSVQATLNTVISPLLFLTGEISATLGEINGHFVDINQKITQEAHQIYDFIRNSLLTAQNTWNQELENFITAIVNAFAWYNEGVNAIETAANDQIIVIDAHNQTTQNIIDEIITRLSLGECTFNDISDLLLSSSGIDGIMPIPTTSLDIDYDQYKISIISPDLFSFNPSFPPLISWEVHFSPLEACLIQISTQLQTLESDILNLPVTVQNGFLNDFPDVFRSQLTGELKDLLVLAVTQLLIRKKDAIMAHFGTMKNSMTTHTGEIESKINDKANEIINKIQDAELQVLNNLPNLLSPSIERYFDKIVDAIEAAREQISADDVNITDFLPNAQEIESIMNTFEDFSPQTPPPAPETTEKSIVQNKSRNTRTRGSRNPALINPFKIQDVYRILCNNFSRTERLAIILAFAPTDIQVSTSDIVDLILQLEP